MILGMFFLKYEGGGGQIARPPPGKTTFKKPSLIRVNLVKLGRAVTFMKYLARVVS